MLNLYIRAERTTKSDTHSDHRGFVKYGKPTNYSEAVKLGFAAAGYGNFYVHTGAAVPSREDQLLLEPRKRIARRNPAIVAAILID